MSEMDYRDLSLLTYSSRREGRYSFCVLPKKMTVPTFSGLLSFSFCGLWGHVSQWTWGKHQDAPLLSRLAVIRVCQYLLKGTFVLGCVWTHHGTYLGSRTVISIVLLFYAASITESPMVQGQMYLGRSSLNIGGSCPEPGDFAGVTIPTTSQKSSLRVALPPDRKKKKHLPYKPIQPCSLTRQPLLLVFTGLNIDPELWNFK